jgi:hypothetical protein
MKKTANNTALLFVASVLMAASATASISPSVATAAECPNEQLRQESNTNPATGQPYDLSLPECRAYEMVSPLEKSGSDIQPNQSQEGIPASVNGNAVGFMSQNAFGDAENYLNAGTGTPANAYLARRGLSGWLTSYALAPRRLIGHPDATHGPDGGPELSAVANCGLTVVDNGTDGTDALCALDQGSWSTTPYYESSTGGIYGGSLSGGGIIRYLGGSAGLSHVVFGSEGGKNKAAQFLPADTSTENGDGLYEVAGLDSSSPTLRLVNVDNNGNEIGPNTGSSIGGISSDSGVPIPCEPAGGSTFGTSYQAISESGEIIYFTACPSNTLGAVNAIYARIGGKETVAVSNPSPSQCTACSQVPQSAAYQGASADGSAVFFTTTQQLVNEDTDGTMDLYEYNFANPPGKNIVQLSRGGTGDLTPGSGANVQGVVRTSSDGSHVYFVATGVLTTFPNGRGDVAALGADNLYAVDTETDETKFVADLCSSASMSGSTGDARCPVTLNAQAGLAAINDEALWGGGLEGVRRLAQTTPDGRYLVFTSYGRLITSGPEADTDEAQDVYRYDFQTGELIRVSIGEPSFGSSKNGNTPGINAEIAPLVTEGVGATGAMADINDWNRAISDNGETIIFRTPEQLQADDVNTGLHPSCSRGVTGATGCNLYVWHYKKKAATENQGEVSTVTDGHAATSADIQFGAGAISATGSDIFFFTRSPLVGQDKDVLIDIYDARIDGGFPAPTVAPSCASEEWTCQGKDSEAPANLKPEGSSTQEAGENLIAPPFKPFPEEVEGSMRIRGHSSKSLSVSVPGPGKLTLSGRGVVSTTKAATTGGAYRLALRLTSIERKLAKRRSVTVTVLVSFVPTSGKSSTATTKVTIKKVKSKKR